MTARGGSAKQMKAIDDQFIVFADLADHFDCEWPDPADLVRISGLVGANLIEEIADHAIRP